MTQTPEQNPAEDTADASTETAVAEQAEDGREAAKYRRRLRDAEAERDTLRGQLDAARRTLIEHTAAAHLSKPSSLWAAGVDPAELLDDDGNPDKEKIAKASADAAHRLGLARPPRSNPAQGANASKPPEPPAKASWQNLLGRH